MRIADTNSSVEGIDRGRSRYKLLGVSGVLVVLCGTLASTLALAQQADNTTLEEVVVTAERRESTVQKTPISMTALSGEQLQQQGIGNIEKLIQEVPGISFTGGGPGQEQLQMRGLNASGGSSPTVGFYLDDVPLTPPGTAQNGKAVIDPDLYDLARVEVLRGPQGTLYGSGSMGGTLRLLTNQPDLTALSATTQLLGSGTQGGGANYGESAMVNLPLIDDKVALRVTETYKYTSGWIDRIVEDPFPLPIATPGCPFYGCVRGNVLAAPVIADHPGANDEQLYNVRAAILIKPVDGLTLTPSAFYQRINMGGESTYDSDPGTLAHYQPVDVAEPFSDWIGIYSFVGKYELPGVQFTSATSDWNRREIQDQDFSELSQALFFAPSFYPPTGVGGQTLNERDVSKQFSEEFRINSTGADRLTWLVGAFYSRFNSVMFQLADSPAFENIGLSPNIAHQFQNFRIDQTAAFGETTFAFTNQFKLTTGIRWYSYSSSVDVTQSGVASASGGPQLTTYVTASNSGFNPKVNFAWLPTDDLTVYTTAAKGFRPGGPNTPIPENGTVNCLPGLLALGLKGEPSQYGPDSVWSYELGEKARLFGDRVSVNSAIYYEKWSDVQQGVNPPCGFDFTANATNADVYGGEIEIQAKITPKLSLDISGGYTHAALAENSEATGQMKGQRIQNVPTGTQSTALVYTQPIGDGLEFTGRVTDQYVGPSTDLTYTLNQLPGYALVNTRFSVGTGKWTAALFVDNLLDKHAMLANANSLTENTPLYNRIVTNQPRTVGLNVDYRFGSR
jgi:iron complex outermembrane receptor protein